MEVKTSKNEKKIIAVSAVILVGILIFIFSITIRNINRMNEMYEETEYSYPEIYKEDICGSWETDGQTFIFGEDNSYTRIKTNETIKGSYEIEGGKIYLDIEGEDRTYIRADIINERIMHILIPLSERTDDPLMKKAFAGGSLAIPVEKTGEC